MREIKFRAWNPHSRLMLYDDKPGDSLVWLSQGQKIEVMQYTGLKDKNGKEIYEGDILLNHEQDNFVCDYSNGGFWFVGRKPDGTIIVDMFEPFLMNGETINNELAEVIGNIYENPELIGNNDA